MRTKIFASDNIYTVGVIDVTDTRPSNAVYKDGAPVRYKPQPEAAGDGTVTACSAFLLGDLPCVDYGSPDTDIDQGWSTRYVSSKGPHSLLMGKFKTEIHNFLNGVAP